MINTRAPDGANKASNCIHQYFLLYKMEISMALKISIRYDCLWVVIWSTRDSEIEQVVTFSPPCKAEQGWGETDSYFCSYFPFIFFEFNLVPSGTDRTYHVFGNSLFLPWQEYHCLRCVRHLWLLSRFSLLDSDWGTRRIRKCERPTCSTNQPTIYIHVIHKIQCILYMMICSVWERTYFPM